MRWVASLWRAVASGGEQWRAVAASGAGEQAVAWMRRAGRGEWVAAGAGLSIKFAASVAEGKVTAQNLSWHNLKHLKFKDGSFITITKFVT